MPTTKSNGKKARRRTRRKPQRKTFLLDGETLRDLGIVQEAARATSETEAVKKAIRLAAQIVRHANSGYDVQATNGDKTVVLDVPRNIPRQPTPVLEAAPQE
jgi:hypothetical protein